MGDGIIENLRRSVIECDPEAAEEWANHAMDEGLDALVCLDALTVAIREVGDGFGAGELFLPDLVGAADAMQRALPVLQAAFESGGGRREPLGVVVLGTVAGDVHTIGKSMVGALLAAEGFEVHDLGIDVPTQKFVDAVKEHRADILAMSTLLTVTAPETKKVIEALEEEGIRERVKVMVGGGAMTEPLAMSMHADGYSSTAPGAVNLARELLGVERSD